MLEFRYRLYADYSVTRRQLVQFLDWTYYIKYLIMLRKVKFYIHLFYNCGASVMCIFLIFLLQNFCNDDVVNSVFWYKCMWCSC